MAVYKTLTIAAGDAGDEAGYVVDLGRRYAVIVVGCADTDGIDAATTMSALADFLGDGTLVDVWFEDGSAIWVSGTLPASSGGSFAYRLRGAIGAQRIRIVLSNDIEADKPTTFFVMGIGLID